MKEDAAMAELVKLILELSSSVKEMTALILVMKRTQAEIFHHSWIDCDQTVDMLRISKRTLRSLRDSGTLPFSRINGKFYYKVNDLEKLLNQNYKTF